MTILHLEEYDPVYLLTGYGTMCAIVHFVSHAVFAPKKKGLQANELAVNRHRYANKIVGMFHATYLGTIALRCGVIRGYDFDGEKLLDAPPLEHFAVGCMMAYLVYDTTFFLWRILLLQPLLNLKEKWSFDDNLTLAHHFLGLLSWYLIYSGTGGVYWAQFIHVAEISTPALNLRWILVKEGITSGPVYMFTSGLFALLFFWSRIPTSTYLVYRMSRNIHKWPSPTIAYFQLFVTTCFFLINVSWMSAIIKLASRALKKSSGEQKKSK